MSLLSIKFNITLLFLGICLKSFAQYEFNYKPIPITDTIPAQLHEALKKRLQNEKIKIKESTKNKDIYKYKCSLYENRCDHVIKNFNNDRFIIDTLFTPYLQKIADEIYQSNPQLKKETKVYAYRSTIPNAM